MEEAGLDLELILAKKRIHQKLISDGSLRLVFELGKSFIL